jgi:transglutaminase-like putative cysteine protease
LFVYGFGLKWVDSGALYDRNCSVAIEPGERSEIGLLVFRAPSAGHEPYQIMVESAVSNPAGTQWYDNGAVFSTTNTAFIKQLGYPQDPTITTNAVVHYDRVNEKVDTGAVSSVVATVQNEQPGPYSVLQVTGAYEWVAGHIEYVTETSGDYWQSAEETLVLGSGDCEDHAILLCSIIDALGGTARVNIIQEHAFPTVYIGPTASDLTSAQASVASYYGMAPSELNLTYLQDQDGYWMVADTTGFPFAGGLPANSEPTTADGEWTVLSDYIVCIDVTGRPATDVLGIF